MDIKKELVKRGVWFRTDTMRSDQAIDFAQQVEKLNYSALWLPETTGRDPFIHMALLATHTDKLIFATGIANIYHRHPGITKQAAATLDIKDKIASKRAAENLKQTLAGIDYKIGYSIFTAKY